MNRLSLRWQLLVIFTLVFTLAFGIFSYVFYLEFSDYAKNLAIEKLQSDANSLTDGAVVNIRAAEVLAIYAEEDEAVREFYADYFVQRQEFYPNLSIEFLLSYVDESQQSVHTLLYVGEDVDMETFSEAITDPDIWAVWVESSEFPLAYDISEQDNQFFTQSSAPILDLDFQPTGVVLDVFIRTDDQLAAVQSQIQETILIAAAIGYPLLLLTIVGVAFTLTRPLGRIITAAQALEKNKHYESEWLASVTKRQDELGQLARVFDQMAIEIRGREEKLKQQIVKLKIEIDFAKQKEQVAEITESDYFQELRKKTEELRANKTDIDKKSVEMRGEYPTQELQQSMNEDDYMANLKNRAQRMKKASNEE